MLNIEKIREFIKQYNISNNKLMQMISSEGTEDNWLENYHIIDHDELLKWKDMIELDKLEKVQDALLIVTDTPDQRRVDSVDFSQFAYKIKIDHHPFVEKFCDIEYIKILLNDKDITVEYKPYGFQTTQ